MRWEGEGKERKKKKKKKIFDFCIFILLHRGNVKV